MKKGKVTCMALRSFKVILLGAFNHLDVYQCKNVSTQCARPQTGETSVDHATAWTLLHVFTPTTKIAEPHLNIQMWRAPAAQQQRNTHFKKKKKSWNKWQLKVAESLYLLDTTFNLIFAIWYLVLFDSVVGVKKSFCIQTYLQNVNIKCVNIYI